MGYTMIADGGYEGHGGTYDEAYRDLIVRERAALRFDAPYELVVTTGTVNSVSAVGYVIGGGVEAINAYQPRKRGLRPTKPCGNCGASQWDRLTCKYCGSEYGGPVDLA